MPFSDRRGVGIDLRHAAGNDVWFALLPAGVFHGKRRDHPFEVGVPGAMDPELGKLALQVGRGSEVVHGAGPGVRRGGAPARWP